MELLTLGNPPCVVLKGLQTEIPDDVEKMRELEWMVKDAKRRCVEQKQQEAKRAEDERKRQDEARRQRVAARAAAPCTRANSAETLEDRGEGDLLERYRMRDQAAVEAVERELAICLQARVARCQALVDSRDIRGAKRCWQGQVWKEVPANKRIADYQRAGRCLNEVVGSTPEQEMTKCDRLPQKTEVEMEAKRSCFSDYVVNRITNCGPLNLSTMVTPPEERLRPEKQLASLTKSLRPYWCREAAASARTHINNRSAAQARRAIERARATCAHSFSQRISKLERQLGQLERRLAAHKARCGGYSAFATFTAIKYLGLSSRKARGCKGPAGMYFKVHNSRGDGWMYTTMPNTSSGAFIYSRRKHVDGELIQPRMMKFVGIRSFRMANGSRATLPAFKILKH